MTQVSTQFSFLNSSFKLEGKFGLVSWSGGQFWTFLSEEALKPRQQQPFALNESLFSSLVPFSTSCCCALTCNWWIFNETNTERPAVSPSSVFTTSLIDDSDHYSTHQYIRNYDDIILFNMFFYQSLSHESVLVWFWVTSPTFIWFWSQWAKSLREESNVWKQLRKIL